MTPTTRTLKGQSYYGQDGQILFGQRGQNGVAFPALVSARDDNGEQIFEWLGEYEIQIPRKPAGLVPIELTLTIDKQNCIHAKAVVEGKPTEADWIRK